MIIVLTPKGLIRPRGAWPSIDLRDDESSALSPCRRLLPDRAVVVGDAPPDLEGVGPGGEAGDEICQGGAHLVVGGLADVTDTEGLRAVDEQRLLGLELSPVVRDRR